MHTTHLSKGKIYQDHSVIRAPQVGNLASLVARLVYAAASVAGGLLAIRFAFSLLGVSRLSTFVNFIYTVTAPLVSPFRGLLGINTDYGYARFDIESVIAIIVYGLVALVIMQVLLLPTKINEEL